MVLMKKNLGTIIMFVGFFVAGYGAIKTFPLVFYYMNAAENGEMVNETDKELTHLQMEKNTLENIKMENNTDKELTHTQMEENTLENLKMVNDTDKELPQRQMEKL